MRVVSYLGVVSRRSNNLEKTDLLKKFATGVNVKNDVGIVHNGMNLIPCDVAVIQGWQHELGKNHPHLQLREQVITTQLKENKFVCVADANLFLYTVPNNEPHHYLRYSFNGVFRNTGIYFDDKPDPRRWQQIKKDLDINIESIKTSGSNLLICLQRDGGWSMQGISIIEWVQNVYNKLRLYTDRKIVIRPHPGDKQASRTYIPTLVRLFKNRPDVEISLNKPLEVDLANTWAVINHNSSSIVGPIIMGYHSFITDPITSQCADVSHHNFENIETPIEFDRQGWLERISMFHWKFSELEDGSLWEHIRPYISYE